MNTTIEVLNLKCGGCANSIKRRLLAIEGTQEISVDLETSKITLDVSVASVLDLVKKKLSSMGYPEIGDANTIVHKAKSIVSCATGRMTSEY